MKSELPCNFVSIRHSSLSTNKGRTFTSLIQKYLHLKDPNKSISHRINPTSRVENSRKIQHDEDKLRHTVNLLR